MKRTIDIVASALGLLLLLPLFAAIGILIKLGSKGPVFFRQERVGRGERPFRIHKFRTMHLSDPAHHKEITVGRDPRITRVGHVLRSTKLDELPQLIDVLVGNMSLVGPRPEVPRYVAYYPPSARAIIFSVRPGITDLASIEFRRESDVLAESDDPEQYYINQILPKKIVMAEQYAQENNIMGDVSVLIATMRSVILN